MASSEVNGTGGGGMGRLLAALDAAGLDPREAARLLDADGGAARLRAMGEAVPQLVWCSRALGDWTWANRRWTDYTGQRADAAQGLGWLGRVHPDDRDAVMSAWRTAEAAGAIDVGHRLLAADGTARWFETRAAPLRDRHGATVEWYGTCTDVHDLRTGRDRQAALAAQLRLRVQDILGEIREIARRTYGTSLGLEDYATHLDGRLAALGRVHGAVGGPDREWVELGKLASEELLAAQAREGSRARVDGPRVRVALAAAETLGLAFHELATNALKYGCLTDARGRIAVTWRAESGTGVDGTLVIDWVETGPRRPPRRARRGFGWEVTRLRLPRELGATVREDVAAARYAFSIALPLGASVAIDGGRLEEGDCGAAPMAYAGNGSREGMPS